MRDAVQGGAAPPGGFFGYELRTTDVDAALGLGPPARSPDGSARVADTACLPGVHPHWLFLFGVRGVFAELEAAPDDSPWGARLFRLRDPDGFRFVISSGP